MEASFDYKTQQRVIKLNAIEEGLLVSALNLADWYTHDDQLAEFSKNLRSELKKEKLNDDSAR